MSRKHGWTRAAGWAGAGVVALGCLATPAAATMIPPDELPEPTEQVLTFEGVEPGVYDELVLGDYRLTPLGDSKIEISTPTGAGSQGITVTGDRNRPRQGIEIARLDGLPFALGQSSITARDFETDEPVTFRLLILGEPSSAGVLSRGGGGSTSVDFRVISDDGEFEISDALSAQMAFFQNQAFPNSQSWYDDIVLFGPVPEPASGVVMGGLSLFLFGRWGRGAR